ncbi:two component transcriptional regulator, LytTR family [Salegentibacter echinorum]|uniref:Two component transcriptional regulator, LytTR family n=1 Tax=Salegentibacter echinorum TaxID=1073325 RepID=A0A1M5I094_SALEC|nr:LytTR family DNA-binding domain-containing protein [Salegentibacter echinorum]SHG21562.1 two component transcriptional regulator, LytTR family [Salegentibacter echinorum]
MRAIVIDDEALARKRILNLLTTVHEVEVLDECANGKTAIKQINSLEPELVFLDISMKDMNGFEVLQQIKTNSKPIVVFVTAYDNYAIKAFDVDAIDFLLKPFRDERFYKTIKKVLALSHTEAQHHFEKRLKNLFQVYNADYQKSRQILKLPIRQGNKTILLEVEGILYICASGYYAEIFTAEKKYVLRESLTNLEYLLKDYSFVRVHRSAIINLNFIKEIVHSEYAEVDVRMIDDKLLRISKPNKKDLFDKLGI